MSETHQNKALQLPSTLFDYAIIRNDISSITRWIYWGVDVNQTLSIGGTPLDNAINSKNLEAVQLLIHGGAVIQKNHIFIAINQNDDAMVHYLIKNGSNISSTNTVNGLSPLAFAIKQGNQKIISALINGGIDLNVYLDGLKPDEFARAVYQNDIAEFLKKHLLKDYETDPSSSLIYYSDDSSEEEDIQNNPQQEQYAKHRIHQCVYQNNINTLTQLLPTKSNLNSLDELGNTPLLIGIANGNVLILKLLLTHGANANTPNTQGFTPLAQAVKYGRTQMVALLLDSGANPYLFNTLTKSHSLIINALKNNRHKEINLLLHAQGKKTLEIEQQRLLLSPNCYAFNPHRHIKIWLSKEPAHFMNDINQLRLVRMRALCPGDEIYLIYESTLLTTAAEQELHSFCAKHTITPKDMRSDIIPQCLSNPKPYEKELIALYEDEINNLNLGGNLAAASDIIRWLSPMYTLGIYSDFDVHVDTRTLNSTLSIDGELVTNLQSRPVDKNNERFQIACSNDIIAIINPESSYIQRIQKAIIDANLPCTRNQIHWLETNSSQEPFILSPREYRNYLLTYQKQFKAYIINDLAQHKDNIPQIIRLLNKYIPYLEQLDDEYLYNVVHATGPATLLSVIKKQKERYSLNELTLIAPFALSNCYALFCAFRSGQGGALHIHPAARNKLSWIEESSQENTCDLSWLNEGENKIKQQEYRFHRSAIKIQTFFKQNVSPKPLRKEYDSFTSIADILITDKCSISKTKARTSN